MREIVRQASRFRNELGHRKLTISAPKYSPRQNQLLVHVKHPSRNEMLEAYHYQKGNRIETLLGGVFPWGDLAK